MAIEFVILLPGGNPGRFRPEEHSYFSEQIGFLKNIRRHEMVSSNSVVVLAAASLVLAVGSAYAEETPMTPDEIKSAWVGKKILIQAPNRTGGTLLADWYLRSDGTVDIQGNGWSHTGKWRLSKDGYCTAYKTLRDGAERCYTVTKNGSNFSVRNLDGSPAGDILKVIDQ